jgi:hypothetical protein
MKRFYLKLAGICVLLFIICGCLMNEPDDLTPEPEVPDIDIPDSEISGPETDEPDPPEPDSSDPENTEPDSSEPGIPDQDISGSEQEPIVFEDRVPLLVINELRTEWASSSSRAEYIEFKILSAGNMDGLQVFIAGSKAKVMVYEFLSVYVQTGEYVVLHLRTLQDSCRDEYGNRLDESGGMDSSPAARDFWAPDSKKLLHKTDAIYVLDRDGHVLDAVMLTEGINAWLKKSQMVEIADFLFINGAWLSADAVDTSAIKTSLTRSISRDETLENTHSAADWYVTEINKGTPGQPNTPRHP